MVDEAMARTRILVYSDSRIFSGAEAVLCDVVKGLSENSQIEVNCAGSRDNPRLFDAFAEVVGESEVLETPSQPLRAAALHLYDPRRLVAVQRLLRQDRWQVVLINLGSAEYGATPLVVRRPSGSKLLGFMHVPGGFEQFGFRGARLREGLARFPMRSLDAVCVMTDSARDTFRRTWVKQSMDVHCLPAPRPKMTRLPRARARAELGLPEGLIVGLAGRISFKQKGHDTFVEAAEMLLRERPGLTFAVAGDGPDREALERLLVQRQITDRFCLLGHVPRIEHFLSTLDVIAIPSRFEGLGLVALEALSIGVPGVATNCDGLRDVWPVRWQIDPDSPRQLASRIGELFVLSPEQRNQVAAEGEQLLEAVTTEDLSAPMGSIIISLARPHV
jgi:glycosyltransferase involved in cell wall biosynthesis